jgi:hypothetical protein
LSLEVDFRTLLESIGAVNAIVGNRIYPMVLPQKATLPAIRYQKITGVPEHSHDGVSGFEVAIPCRWIAMPRPISVRSRCAMRLQAGLDGFNNTSPAAFAILLQNDFDAYEEAPRTFRKQLDFQVQREY